MSSLKENDQTVVEAIVEKVKLVKDTERCGNGKVSKLPTYVRCSSASGQKSKIPTNFGNAEHPGRDLTQQSESQDSSRVLTAFAADKAAICSASPINTLRFPTSKSLTVAKSPSLGTKATKSWTNSTNSAMAKRQWEIQFSNRRKRYSALKKELADKQKKATDLYEEMTQLRDKLVVSGAQDPGKIETINRTGVPPIPNFPTYLPLIHSHAISGNGEHVLTGNLSLSSEFVSSTILKICEVPQRNRELCYEILRKNSELLEFFDKCVRSFNKKEVVEEIFTQIQTYINEISLLELRLEQVKKSDDILVNGLTKNISVLWNEFELSREGIREFKTINEEIMNDMKIKLDIAMEGKKSMQNECEQIKQCKDNLETELQKVRAKLCGMDARTSEDKTRIGPLQSRIKNLELQLKQKESGVEQHSRELQKSLKSSEILLAKTEKQRDTLESRLNELKKTAGSTENEAEMRIKELSKKLAVVEAELVTERDKRQICKRDVGLHGVCDGMLVAHYSEHEEKIKMLKREKLEILRVVNLCIFNDESSLVSGKIDENDDINEHENCLGALTKKMQDFRSNLKFTQEKNEDLHRQLREFQLRLDGQSNKDSAKSLWPDREMDLTKQISDLRCTINDLERHNTDLEIALNQKQLEIEEQDRVMRGRSDILNERDEVTDFIKEKPDSRSNTGENRHLSLVRKKINHRDREQVDRSIAEKTENLQQLYMTLETKQMQITRLEQLVQQLEIQQESAQEQRTRLEKKIAQLQLALYQKKGHRYVNAESSKVANPTFRDRSRHNVCQSDRSPVAYSSPLAVTSFSDMQSQPRPAPLHRPCRIQRAKTLNSLNLEISSPSSAPRRIYASNVMDEVARSLQCELEYNYEKRGITARDENKLDTKEDHSSIVPNCDDEVIDYIDVTKKEIQEFFYNWLVQPKSFNSLGYPSGVDDRANEVCPLTDSSGKRFHNSSMSINHRSTIDRPHYRERIRGKGKHCNKESTKYNSPEFRRTCKPKWNACTLTSTKASTSRQETIRTRTRR